MKCKRVTKTVFYEYIADVLEGYTQDAAYVDATKEVKVLERQLGIEKLPFDATLVLYSEAIMRQHIYELEAIYKQGLKDSVYLLKILGCLP